MKNPNKHPKHCGCGCNRDIDVTPVSEVTSVGNGLRALEKKVDQNTTRLNYYQKTLDSDIETAEYVKSVFQEAVEQQGNVEVIDARGGLPSLADRLDSLADQLDSVDSHLEVVNEQLAMAMPQIDFVKLVRDHNLTNQKMKTKVKGDRIIEAFVPLNDNEFARYEFGKDTNDDYIKLHNGETAFKSNFRDGKNYDTLNGTWVTSGRNHYTSQVGATMTVTFTGHKLEFCFFADNRGGVWRFVVDGKESTAVTFSTFGNSNPGTTTLFQGLEDTEHTVVATFMGDDPNNPPSSGTGTSRGWVYYGDESVSYRSFFASTSGALVKDLDILYPSSNKEYAIQIKPIGTPYTAQWLPEHNSIGTVYAISQKVLIDGIEVTNWTPQTAYKESWKVEIIQMMSGVHPDEPSNPVAEIYSVHTLTSRGLAIKVKIKWLRDVEITNGYGMMFPVHTSFGNELVTSFKNKYASIKTDGSNTNLVSEKDNAISFAYVNNSGSNSAKNTVVAMTITDVNGTYRQGKLGRRNDSILWLQHRSNLLQKLYLHSYADTTALAGETYEVSGEFIIGKLPMASDIII